MFARRFCFGLSKCRALSTKPLHSPSSTGFYESSIVIPKRNDVDDFIKTMNFVLICTNPEQLRIIQNAAYSKLKLSNELQEEVSRGASDNKKTRSSMPGLDHKK
tara:strand:+ start:1569 stop:1880 length:312 start_codon:yes stop_codon:yes gene_type:complete